MRVARVAVDTGLPHLDYLFDYAIPEKFDDVRPGVRVRVRFAGRLCNGYVIECADESSFTGKLANLSAVVSDEVVITPEQVRLLRAVADHYGGIFFDVARLAVPPRHATTEKAEQRNWPAPARSEPRVLPAEPHGERFLDLLSAGGSPRALWQVTPSCQSDVPAGVADAVGATLSSGRGAIVVVPDERSVERVHEQLAERFGTGCVAVLHSELGPAARYRNYLAIVRGEAKIVVGTRPAGFAPVHQLGLVVVVDEGADLLADQLAPYPHARDVAAIRASLDGCALLLTSFARSCEAQAWVDRGWLAVIGRDAAEARRLAPAIRVTGDSDAALARDPLARQARIPQQAFETIRTGLSQGPVLIQVPRAGYYPALACDRCRERVLCQACSGPVRARKDHDSRVLECSWCGKPQPRFRCPHCGGDRLRAPVIGSQRTAEELGRAFPGYRLIDSSGDRVVDTVGDTPALVVATPGAEPRADAGYAALILLDTFRLTQRPDLRASEEALRRWLNAVALVRPGERGGTVCAVGVPDDRSLQALVRLDPAGLARRELAERAEAGFPPAWCLATVGGDAEAVAGFADMITLPDGAELLHGDDLILRIPAARRSELVAAVKAAVAGRSARKAPGSLRVHIDG